MSESSERELATRLKNTPPVLSRRTYHDGSEEFDITLAPYATMMESSVDYTDPAHVYTGIIEVTPELRNNGLGTYLIKSFFAYCKSREIERVEASIINPTALKLFGQILGHEALSYTEIIDNRTVDLPMSFTQAQESLSKVSTVAADYDAAGSDWPEDFDRALTVLVDMTNIDVTGWQLPAASDT